MHVRTKTLFCVKMEPFLNAQHKQILIAKGNIQKLASHPSIVKVYATYDDDHYVYQIMEYLPGGDLFEMVSAIGPIPEQMAKCYAAQLVLSVEFLHSKGILHNDIKLENLLLDNVNILKLTDFGLATSEFEATPEAINGTPEYMSPETILTKNHSRVTDWWSVGVCIFEMLTGNLPFNMNDTDSTLVTFQKILQSKLVIPNTINSVAADLLFRLLTVDSSSRLGSGINGSHNVKSHPWFSDIQWENVLNEQGSGVQFVRKLET